VDSFSCTSNAGKQECEFTGLPGDKADLVTFEVSAGVYTLHIEMGDDTLVKSFRSTRYPHLSFDVDFEGGAIGVPKVGLGFRSVEATQILDQSLTCGGTGEFCVRKEMKAVVGYRTYDSTVSFSGFQMDIEGDVVWKRAVLPSVLLERGFSLSDNKRGTFICFSMQAATFPHTTEDATVLDAYFERELEHRTLVIKRPVVSNSAGSYLNNIVYYTGGAETQSPAFLIPHKTGLGGAVQIPGCDGFDPPESAPDGYCDDEDFDCDCCINNVDKFPADNTKGCGLCGDVNNNGELEIMDVLLSINMVEGMMQTNVKDGDADGDEQVTIRDIVQIVESVLSPELEVKTRPCGQIV